MSVFRLKSQKTYDDLSLVAVLHYVVFRFLQQTTFQFVYTDLYKAITLTLLLITGAIRFFFIVSKWKEQFKKNLLLCILAGCMAIPFIYVAWKQNLRPLVFFPVVAFCLYKMEPKKVLRPFTVVVGILLMSTMICSMTGCIKNLTYFGKDYSFVASYGIINTTDFAAYFLIIVLCAWVVSENNNWTTTCVISIVALACGFVSYWLSQSRTTLICCILVSLLSLWTGLEKRIKKKTFQRVTGLVDKVTIISFPACSLLLGIMSFLYGKGVSFAERADVLFSNRFSSTWHIFEKYGLHLFGRNFETHGWGGTMMYFGVDYDFPDSSYSFIAFRYGVVIYIIISALWVWMTWKAVKSGRKEYAYALAVLAIYGLSESHLVDINYNIFLFMSFCSFARKEKGECLEEKKSDWFAIASAVVLSAIVILIYPRIGSWLRTLFFLKDWNNGSKAVFALTVCVVLLTAVFFFWKSICSWWKKKDRRTLAVGVTCIATIAAVFVLMNVKIYHGISERSVELQEERTAIEFVRDNATQPVYAFEKAELYQRTYGGFTDLPMSAEDILRTSKGSIITDSTRELSSIVYNWGYGKYLQFSPYSGIYSYDPAVIEGLASMGYEWKDYYDSERTCSLSDLALMNGLQGTEEGIVLNGSSHSISQNWYFDQWAGEYEARITASMDPGQQGKIFTFKVMGYKDEKVLLEREIYAEEFDTTGHLSIVIPYTIESTPKSDFLIIAEEGVQVTIEEIAWRRIS